MKILMLMVKNSADDDNPNMYDENLWQNAFCGLVIYVIMLLGF